MNVSLLECELQLPTAVRISKAFLDFFLGGVLLLSLLLFQRVAEELIPKAKTIHHSKVFIPLNGSMKCVRSFLAVFRFLTLKIRTPKYNLLNRTCL